MPGGKHFSSDFRKQVRSTIQRRSASASTNSGLHFWGDRSVKSRTGREEIHRWASERRTAEGKFCLIRIKDSLHEGFARVIYILKTS